MRVLIADDNPVFLAVLREMLRSWGYDVLTATDGAEAWNVLRSENAPPIAILDWMMPLMDGIEVCRRVRISSRRSGYPYILILTAKADPDSLIEALDAGADDFIQKPFRSPELRARLRTGRRILELQERLELLAVPRLHVVPLSPSQRPPSTQASECDAGLPAIT
jgi:DNA-binding response OmpR family regulator